MRELTYAEAALEAVAEEMRRDAKIFYMSTDAIGPLLQEFGEKRVRATPIAEAALTGMAIGAAGSGFRPIVDWRQVTFSFVAMDQIVNQAAKIHYMFGGQRAFPILYRAAVGGGTRLAAQHAQCPYSMFMNLAGLKMFLPSTPRDIKGLLNARAPGDDRQPHYGCHVAVLTMERGYILYSTDFARPPNPGRATKCCSGFPLFAGMTI